ncbi:MAG: energy-dependent translational throttle protein EttA [Rhodospirillaceae bacterium]|nr:energy-dependent translational throttle protein EttA [Rhodospirillaceae bacterium]
MSVKYVYTMSELSKKFDGGRQVLKDISLSFIPGAKIGVLGLNGSGKSTLLKIMAGLEKDFSGEAWAADNIKIGYLEQEPMLDDSKTVQENVMMGVSEVMNLIKEFEDISMKFSEPLSDDEMNKLLSEQGDLQTKIDTLDGWEVERIASIAMDALRCPSGDLSVTKISGGERRRVALCRLLLERPDMLLLDEPTNHLDAESVSWLEIFLSEYPGTVVAVTHDRYFLDNVAEWILELDRGEGIPWKGNYSSWLDQKQKRLELEGKHEESRQRTLRNELDWVNQTPKARQSKGKARIKAYEELLSKQLDRTLSSAQILIPAAPRLGDLVIKVENLKKSYGEKLLFENLNFSIPPGAIVGIVGSNGAGKTTLFNLLSGVEKCDSGSIKIGETVCLGYVDQSRDALNNDSSVWEEISEGESEVDLGKNKIQSRAYVGAFNFKGGDQQKKVGSLSGGERNRVHLAKMLKSGSNVLLLDEPTNDLDVDTLRALEDALESFAGCVVIISHDRWFLDRIATHILAFEGDSHVEWFEGNYQDYEQDLKRRSGGKLVQPKRIKYKTVLSS